MTLLPLTEFFNILTVKLEIAKVYRIATFAHPTAPLTSFCDNKPLVAMHVGTVRKDSCVAVLAEDVSALL